MIRLHPFAATLAAAALLAGCSNDSPDPLAVAATGAPTTSTPATSAAPNASNAPNPIVTRDLPAPVLSELGKDFSQDGASAFASYYVQVLNYSRNSGDINPLRLISDTGCSGCDYNIDEINEMSKEGYAHLGLETRFHGTQFRTWDPTSGEAQMDVVVDRPEHQIVDANGRKIADVPGLTGATLYLWVRWQDSRWMIWETQ